MGLENSDWIYLDEENIVIFDSEFNQILAILDK